METNHYSYNGKSWRPSPTMSDYNSFFHSAFGVKTDENGYFDKFADVKRMQWITFLTYCECETMSSCLADMLRKCFSVNEKCKSVCGDDKQKLKMYIRDLKTNEPAITKEEVAILATLENTNVVILSNGGLHPTIVIKPNLSILGSYQKEVPKKKPKEVVLYLEENVFTKLEPVTQEQPPKPIQNKVQVKSDPTKYKKGGSAGSEGVEYQIKHSEIITLNAMKYDLSEWKLSTENVDAGKFDDNVFEGPEGADLIQSKHKKDSNKRITFDELFSTNSKKDDFSLPKYFLSYMSIKEKFNIRNLIICTNAGVDENVREKYLNEITTNTKSLLQYQDGEYSYYTLKDTDVISDLEEKTIQYYDQNFNNEGIQKSDITKENLSDFLKRLQLFFCYPSLLDLEKFTEKLLSLTVCCSNSQGQITEKELYDKLKNWYKQPEGIYLTNIHAKAMFAEIWTNKYCEQLKRYKISLQKNNFNFQGQTQIFNVISSHGNLLQAIKVYDAVHNEKILSVNPDDGFETQKLILDAFAFPQYVFLIIDQIKVVDESVIIEMCTKLRDILAEKKYKKVILITGNNDTFFRCMMHSESHYESMDVPVTFADLSNDFQDKLLKKKSIVFQGKSVCLEELLADRVVDYANAVDQEILENIIASEVKVGVQLLEMDKNIAPFYINRIFKRSVENIHEKDIYEVKEKVVLISDNAGVGKTTVLSKLATNIKQRDPNLWVIKIALTEYTHILKDLKESGESISVIKLLNSKKATKLEDGLESYVFSIEEKVVLMFDGVDEVSPDYTELVYNLLTQCLRATNIANLFITTRPHKMNELKEILKVDPFELQPLTEQNQVDFLIGYWTHKLNISHKNKEKCEKYGRALLERMSCWTEKYRCAKEKFTAIALQLRMVAEIFQESVTPNGPPDWESCKEYLEGANESPNLPAKIELKQLYDLFIERKRHIYIQRGNPSGNCEANTALNTKFNESLVYHRKLALEVILSKEYRQLFSCYQETSEVINETVLKIGIVQEANEKFYFIHRTFAEYFVAESLLSELQLQSQNPNLNFQNFFIDVVLYSTDYKVIRFFLDGFLQNMVDRIPSNIFNSYQSQRTSFFDSSFHSVSNKYRRIEIWFTHFFDVFFGEGCVSILQLILNCIDFKIIKNKTYSGKDLHQQKYTILTEINRKRRDSNILKVMKIMLQDMGLEFWNYCEITPLMEAAKSGHLKMVTFLVDQGAKINSPEKQRTALHTAVESGHMDIVKYLVQQGAEIDCRSPNGYTPLHYAAKRTDLECFKYLIESGADVTIRDNYYGHTVLHFVAMAGNSSMDLTITRDQLAIIKSLVECNTDFNIKDKDGYTPLHFAAKESHPDTVKLIHDSGGDLNIMNNNGQIALHLAAEYGNLDNVKYLVMFNEDVDVEDNNGCTPLLLAASRGHIDVVEFLQQQNANIHIRDNGGKTILHVSARHVCIHKIFIKRVADVNAKDNNGCTALHSAATYGCLDVVKYLSETGAELNVTDSRGRTALHSAVIESNLHIVKYLCEVKADLTVTDNDGRTILHSAATSRKLDLVKYLLAAGAVLDTTDDHGRTPLHSAAAFGRLNVVKYLVEAGAAFTIKDKDDCTPTQLAGFKYHLEVVKYFDLIRKKEAKMLRL